MTNLEVIVPISIKDGGKMLKRIFIVLVLCAFTVSCTNIVLQPTATSTPEPTFTASPTETLTPTPTETATPTATATQPVALDDGLGWEHINEHSLPLPEEYVFSGVKMKLLMGIDASFQAKITSMNLHKNWTSDKRYKAEDALYAFTLHMLYGVWVENQDAQKTGNEKIDFDTWVEWLVIAQEGGQVEDWEKVAVSIWANDATTPYKMEKMKIVPFYIGGSELAEDLIPITELDYVVVNGYKIKNIVPGEWFEYYREGLGSSIYPDGKLVILIAPAQGDPDTWSAQNITGALPCLPAFLYRKANKCSWNRDYMEFIGRHIRWEKWSSFIQITPKSPVEIYQNS